MPASMSAEIVRIPQRFTDAYVRRLRLGAGETVRHNPQLKLQLARLPPPMRFPRNQSTRRSLLHYLRAKLDRLCQAKQHSRRSTRLLRR
jgi:hypothetical protein